ncbi:MAG: hypothetical protein WHS46_10870 [Desulfosoma sp.]
MRLLVILVLIFAVCSPALARETNENKKRRVPHITAQQAYALFQQGKIILIDVHPGASKKHASIPGALYVSADRIDKGHVSLPKDKLLGLYCE